VWARTQRISNYLSGILRAKSLKNPIPFRGGSVKGAIFTGEALENKRVFSIPNFIIIGVQKGGTTSLYNYLIQHPKVAPALQKEVQFFSLNFDKGRDWYFSQFPSVADGKELLTGEASPYYIFHPHVAKRIHQFFPDVKLIALLREPVARAISHYFYYLKIGFESLSFPDAIALESSRLTGEIEKMLEDESYCSYNHRHYTYLTRGIYADQLPEWFKYFSREQLLILNSDDLYKDTVGTMNQVLNFLELPHFQLETYPKYNAGEYKKVSPVIEEKLREFFRPHNQRLAALLGTDFGWD